MELGEALEIVYEMAKYHWETSGIIIPPAKNPYDINEAINQVHDFIMNNFEED